MATRTWNGGGGNDNWSTGANWSGGVAPNAGDDLAFGGTTRLTPHNDYPADTSFNNITFNNGSGTFTISGNRIKVTGTITNVDADAQTLALPLLVDAVRTVNCNTGNIVLSGDVSGAGGFTKTGGYTLILSSATSDFSGGVLLSRGTLRLSASSGVGVGPAGTGTITVNIPTSNGRVYIDGGVTISNALVMNTNSPSTGAGTLQYTPTTSGTAEWSGPITINSTNITGGHFVGAPDPDVLVLSGIITSSVQVTVRQLNVRFSNASSSFTSLLYQAGTLSIGCNDGLPTNVSVFINISGNATFDLNGYDQTVQSIARSSASYTSELTSSSGTPTFTIQNSTSVKFKGVVSGSLSLVKEGTGDFVLSGANTYTGTTTIRAGILQIGEAGTTGSLSPDSDIINNAALIFNRTDTITQGTDFASVISGTGTVTVLSGVVIFSGDNTYTGATTISGGTLLVNGSLHDYSVVTATGGGKLGGSGTVNMVSVDPGSYIVPGAADGVSIATFNVSEVVFGLKSFYAVDLDGALPSFDQLKASGTVDCGSARLAVASAPNSVEGKVYIIVQASEVLGTFYGLPNGAKFTQCGREFQIAYSGTQVTLTDIGMRPHCMVHR